MRWTHFIWIVYLHPHISRFHTFYFKWFREFFQFAVFIIFLIFIESFVKSNPAILAVPDVGVRLPVSILINVDLYDVRDRHAENYSGGMRKRLELACGLMNKPEVFFLDEPTLGLDVTTRENLWKYIRSVQKEFHITTADIGFLYHLFRSLIVKGIKPPILSPPHH